MTLSTHTGSAFGSSLYEVIDDLLAMGVPSEKCEQIAADIYRAAMNPAATIPVRVWTLGNLEHKILPTMAAIEKLKEFVVGWDGQEPFDLIWGPELKLHRVSVTPEDLDVILSADQVLPRAQS